MRRLIPLRSPAPSRPETPAVQARRRLPLAAAAAGALLFGHVVVGPAAAAPVNTADLVVDYDAGDNADTNYEHPEAALGRLNGDTGFGYGLNPFIPPWSAQDIVMIGPGGHLTLRTAVPFRTSGFNLAVYVSNGIEAVDEGGEPAAGSPPTFFSPTPRAKVAVSSDNVNWEYLNAGKLIDFNAPTNAYLDAAVSFDEYGYVYQAPGEVEADMAKPWTGSLSDLSGDTYDEMLAEFDGSAGGNWLDLDGVPLEFARYVRFEVTDPQSRMVVDAIATTDALPEPSAAVAVLGGLLLAARRPRRRGRA